MRHFFFGTLEVSRRDLRKTLEALAVMRKAARAYFAAEGFEEVMTSALLPFPNLDPNVRPVPVSINSPDGQRRLWLHTSPELSMKKLLAEGSGSIFQICPVYRDEEPTPQHRREFNMLEWYRADADYEAAMEDTMRVLRKMCMGVSGSMVINRAGVKFDLDGHWEVMTMASAFRSYAGVESFTPLEISSALKARGYRCSRNDGREELFFRLYVDAVEPHLGRTAPTIVKDFPDFLGSMAKPKPGCPGILERFEVFIGGFELANGYSELTDGEELGRRMEKVRESLAADGVDGLEVDKEFLDAVGRLDPCAGVSVGMDRLAMLLLGTEDIGEVIFP